MLFGKVVGYEISQPLTSRAMGASGYIMKKRGAELYPTLWAGTRPAPTTLNNDKRQSSNDKNRRSGGVHPRLTNGDDAGGDKTRPYDIKQ